MKKLTIGQIEKAVGGVLLSGSRKDFAQGVSTDSRSVASDNLFIPLIGEKFDAHIFIRDVIQSGTRSFIVSNKDIPPCEGCNVILVSDTASALRDLASYYLSTFSMKKIGITGSTGKTTTKDMLYWICKEKYKTESTKGNFNNDIGLPLTVLSFAEDTEVGILEMGAETLGEIHRLAGVVRPDIGIITNIGISHLKSFGSRENIQKAKLEITDYFDKDALLIVNEESDLLSRSAVSGSYRLKTIGSNGKSDYIISDICDFGEIGIEFKLEHMRERTPFKLGIPGRHNAVNASLAVAAAMDLGITMSEAASGLQKMVLTEKRLAIKGKDGMKIIDDTYNASPDSMRAAIDVLASTKGMRKIAILGDMFDLGEDTKIYHEQIGEYAAKKRIDLLVAIGEMAEYMAEAAAKALPTVQVLYFRDKEQFASEMKKMIAPGDVILVKGSRGMAMDQIVKKIME